MLSPTLVTIKNPQSSTGLSRHIQKLKQTAQQAQEVISQKCSYLADQILQTLPSKKVAAALLPLCFVMTPEAQGQLSVFSVGIANHYDAPPQGEYKRKPELQLRASGTENTLNLHLGASQSFLTIIDGQGNEKSAYGKTKLRVGLGLEPRDIDMISNLTFDISAGVDMGINCDQWFRGDRETADKSVGGYVEGKLAYVLGNSNVSIFVALGGTLTKLTGNETGTDRKPYGALGLKFELY